MPEITLEQALELVEYIYSDGDWRVLNVCGSVYGSVGGYVGGDVYGDVRGSVVGYVDGYVGGDVRGDVRGSVCGTISGRQWQFVETPLEKLKRLIESDAPKDQVLAALEEVAL